MKAREFRPGFRFSIFDGLLLLVGGLGMLLLWPVDRRLALVVGFVVGHFFLFCNVFRISRGLELAWATVFTVLAGLTLVTGTPMEWVTATVTLGTTIVVFMRGVRSPWYHGVGWRRWNPRLPEWWERHAGARAAVDTRVDDRA
jgi:hypothetical protein